MKTVAFISKKCEYVTRLAYRESEGIAQWKLTRGIFTRGQSVRTKITQEFDKTHACDDTYEVTKERESWGSVLPSAFQYLLSLLSLHSPEHTSEVENEKERKANKSS
jgi:hypothetical protein